MKFLITILTLVCLSAVLHSPTWAQGDASRTYTGVNGPQGGPGLPLPAPDKYVVNVYGGQNDFSIVVYSPGGDICGREFYFTGTVSFQPNQNKGSIAGPMQRCTNPDLVVFCDHKPIYEVGYTGTIERTADHSRYFIKITWPDEKWLKEDCQKKREEIGTETIVVYYQPPTPPPPTIKQLYDRLWDKGTDHLYKRVRGGEWLKDQKK